MGRSVASYSGHILKLVPGDFQWSLPQFPIVIVWNGSDTFMPTQFVKANAVTDWKMGVIGRHLGEAIKLFEEVEEDVVHSHKPALLKFFRNLRNSTIVTDMLLGDTVAGHSQNIPPVSYGPKKGTSTHLTYHVDPHYIPQAEFRHDVNLDVLNVPGMPAKSAETPEAPIRGTFAFFPDPNAEFPVQDFSVPVEIFLSVPPGARNFPPKPETPAAPAPVAPPVPTERHLELFKTISSRQTGKAVTIPMPPPPPKPSSKTTTAAPAATTQTITSTVSSTLTTSSTSSQPSTSTSSSTYVKKYNCRFCKYSTDRKNDWDNHCNTNTGVKYKCGDASCKKIFSSPKNRDFHFKNVHLAIKRFTCGVEKCNHQENDYGKMKVHHFEKHGIGEECRCRHCDKKLTKWRVMERHQGVCQTEKDKKCPVCNKGYKSRERLINHMETQHGDTDLMMCDKCGGVFTTKESLRVHISQQHQ